MKTITLHNDLKDKLSPLINKCTIVVVTNWLHVQFTEQDHIVVPIDKMILATIQFVGKTKCPDGIFATIISDVNPDDKDMLIRVNAELGTKAVHISPYLLQGKYRGKYVDIVKDEKKATEANNRMIDSIVEINKKIEQQEVIVDEIIMSGNFLPLKYVEEADKLEKLRKDKNKLVDLNERLF